MIPDYHLHTVLCKHAEGSLIEFRDAARKLEIGEICFTDHVPSMDGYDPQHRMTLAEFPAYRRMVRDISNGSAPLVLFGIEADYYEGCVSFLEKWLPAQSFDFVLGSVHYIDNWGFDNPEERSVWDSVDINGTWKVYFSLVQKLAETRLFDAVAHLDLPKKFGHRPGDNHLREMAAPALDSIAKAGMAVEINTSGLRRPVKEIYPSLMLLEMARERDIPICFGSDAHMPEEIGFQFDAAINAAREAGYTSAIRFRGRNMARYSF